MKSIKELAPYTYIWAHCNDYTPKEVKAAQDKIVIAFYSIAIRWAHNMHGKCPRSDVEEIITVAINAIYEALKTHDPNYISKCPGTAGRKMKLTSWIYNIMRKRIWGYIRRGTMGKRQYNVMYNINQRINDEEDTREWGDLIEDVKAARPMQMYIAKDYFEEIKSRLSEKDLANLKLIMDNDHLTNRAMSRKWGMSYEGQRLRKIALLKRIRKAMKIK